MLTNDMRCRVLREANTRLLKELYGLRKTFSNLTVSIATTDETDAAIARAEAELRISVLFASDHVMASSHFFNEKNAVIKCRTFATNSTPEERQVARRNAVIEVIAEVRNFSGH